MPRSVCVAVERTSLKTTCSRQKMLIKFCSLMYVFAVTATGVTGLKAMRGPEFISANTKVGYEPGTLDEGNRTSGYSHGQSISQGNVTSSLGEEVKTYRLHYEGSSRYISNTPGGSAEQNETSEFQRDYVTNKTEVVTDDGASYYTERVSESQEVSAIYAETTKYQHEVWSEDPQKYISDETKITAPVGEIDPEDVTTGVSYKDTKNVVSTQESGQLETSTEFRQSTAFNGARTAQQTDVQQGILESFESSANRGAATGIGHTEKLPHYEEEFNKKAEIAWNYTERFLRSGDLEDGQAALNLTRQYVEEIRHHKLSASGNRNVSDELLDHGPRTWAKLTHLNELENTVHRLEEVYRLAAVVETSDMHFHNYSETHNFSEDMSFVLGAEKNLNDLEVSVRHMYDTWQEYGLPDYFAFPWNRSLNLDSDRDYLKAVNKSIHDTHLLTLKKKEIEDMFQYYVYPIFYLLILVLGAAGNGALLLMFVKYKDIRTAPNIMIFNLALMDIMNLFVNAPLYYVSKYHTHWLYLGGYGCRLFATFRFLNHSIIEFSVAGLSVQRYCACVATLRNPTSRWKLSARCTTAAFMLAVWLLAVAVSLPPALVFEYPSGVCFPLATPQIKALNVFYFVLYSFVLPIAIAVFSAITAHKLKTSVGNIPGELRYRFQEESRYRSANVLAALAVSYACTHIPRSIWFFLVSFFHLDRLEMKYIYIDEVTNYLIFSNSCMNPLALYISSGKFRQLFKRHLFCVRQKGGQCAPLDRQVTASSSTRLVFVLESYTRSEAGHKTSLNGLDNIKKQGHVNVSFNPGNE